MWVWKVDGGGGRGCYLVLCSKFGEFKDYYIDSVGIWIIIRFIINNKIIFFFYIYFNCFKGDRMINIVIFCILNM